MTSVLEKAVVVSLLGVLCGCAGWEDRWVRPEHLVATEQPKEIRITHRDGSQMIVVEPAVERDSLVGWYGGPGSEEFGARRQVKIALVDIASTSVREDGRNGFILVSTGVVLVGLIALGIAVMSGGSLTGL